MRVLWDESPLAEHDSPAALPERTGVAVVGAGIVGSSIALALAGHGIDVTLVERDRVASGASGRNDGQLLLEAAELYSRMVESRGRQVARDILSFKVESQAALVRFLARHQLEEQVEWRCRGSYFLAASDHEARELRDSARLLLEDGFEVEWHDADTVRQRISGGEFLGGLYAPGDALCNPRQLTRAIAGAAREAGVCIVEKCAVTRVEDGRLITDAGALTADIIVLATNAWTGELIGRPDWIWPVRGQVLATQPVAPFLDLGCSTNFGYEYWRQSRDGRLVAGGFRWTAEETEKGTGLELNGPVQARIESFLLCLYGERFGDLRVEHRWAGTMGFSRDGLPLLGPLPGRPTVWLAAGFTGYGLGLGFGVGECIAERVATGETRYPVGPLSTRRLT